MGKSVRALEDIPSGSIVTQLNGELINREEGEKREQTYEEMIHSYMVFFRHRVKKKIKKKKLYKFIQLN